MFKRLIVATDLTEDSDSVVSNLDGLKAYGAEECLLVGCVSTGRASSLGLSYNTNTLDESLKRQKKLLESQGYKVCTRIVTGAPKGEINSLADQEKNSLIVVVAEEDTLASQFLSGSIAYDIIHHAQKPVLLLRLQGDSKAEDFCLNSISCGIDNHILFPTDFSENAELAFEYLEEMVSSGVTKVTLLHIQDKGVIKPYLEDRLEEFNEIDLDRLETLKKRLIQKGDVEVETVVKFGSPSVEILDLVERLGVQLVLMGSQGRGFVKELFLGSVSNNIARHSKASVLLVPAKRTRDFK